jgi:hypothetical protein
LLPVPKGPLLPVPKGPLLPVPKGPLLPVPKGPLLPVPFFIKVNFSRLLVPYQNFKGFNRKDFELLYWQSHEN